MSKKVFESKVIYENKVPPFDYEKAKEEAETIELPPDYKRPFDTPEEMEEEETELTEEPAFQWWVVILVGFAIIAIIVAVIVVTKVTRSAKLK